MGSSADCGCGLGGPSIKLGLHDVSRCTLPSRGLQRGDAGGDLAVVAVVGGVVGQGVPAFVVLQQLGDVLGDGHEFAGIGWAAVLQGVLHEPQEQEGAVQAGFAFFLGVAGHGVQAVPRQAGDAGVGQGGVCAVR